jgi:NTE family protein
MKLGLVLSGGGAKGAYQVGVVKALVEMGTQVDAVAGASIGALNAAILASSPSLKDGAERMEEVWMALANKSPLAPNLPAYLRFLMMAGINLNFGAFFNAVTKAGKMLGHGLSPQARAALEKMIEIIPDKGLLSKDPIIELIDHHLDLNALKNGIPLYISAFKSSGSLLDIASIIAADIGLRDSSPSEFIHIQSLPVEDQKKALLASAALPLIFAPQEINNNIYHDGGMGGWQKMQGNTPITPLLQSGIKNIIVTHLSDGSLWSRHDFPEATILEIRPQSSIGRDDEIKDILGFDQRKIPSWIEQGYRDTLHCIGRVMEATSARNELRASEAALKNSTNAFDGLDHELSRSLQRLR